MCTWAAHSVVFLLSVSDSPGVGFWASSELLEFYDTPNMHQAFSFLDRFLAKSSPFFSILPNFYFAPRSAAQLAHESRQPYAHPRHSEVCPCAPRPARTAPGQLISRSRLRVLASADPSARAVFALHSRSSSTGPPHAPPHQAVSDAFSFLN